MSDYKWWEWYPNPEKEEWHFMIKGYGYVDIHEWLEKAVLCLTKKQQLVAALIIKERLTTQEIARRLGCSDRAVQRIKHRIVERLKVEAEKSFFPTEKADNQ